jgi:hypothetical protein
MKIALFLARFAAKAPVNPELFYGNRSTVIATNAVRKAARQ